MIRAVEKGRSGECYILANEPITFKEFCNLVTEESGGKKVGFYIPVSTASAMSHVTEAMAKKTGEEPILTSFNVYSMARNNQFDSGKAREELGYKTRAYKDTIHDQISWMLEEGLIRRDEQ